MICCFIGGGNNEEKIGDTEYVTLEEAIIAAGLKDEIYLLKDINRGGQSPITIAKKVTLDKDLFKIDGTSVKTSFIKNFYKCNFNHF